MQYVGMRQDGRGDWKFLGKVEPCSGGPAIVVVAEDTLDLNWSFVGATDSADLYDVAGQTWTLYVEPTGPMEYRVDVDSVTYTLGVQGSEW